MALIRLSELNRLSDAYKSRNMTASRFTRYPPNPTLLHKVSLFQGDITRLEVDSIVNAANKRLLGGGGVDGAIHAAAGPELLEECRTLNGCRTGEAKMTRAYRLPSRHVIHTVGPIYFSSHKERMASQLASCYRNSLELAVKNSLKHIAFSSISTGVYGYPIVDATHVALNEVRCFLDSEYGRELELVIFVVWSDADKNVYEELIPQYFPAANAPSNENL